MAVSAVGITLMHLQERGQNLKIGAGHVCTDESSVYGLDKGVTGTDCEWHWRRSTWQAALQLLLVLTVGSGCLSQLENIKRLERVGLGGSLVLAWWGHTSGIQTLTSAWNHLGANSVCMLPVAFHNLTGTWFLYSGNVFTKPLACVCLVGPDALLSLWRDAGHQSQVGEMCSVSVIVLQL